ncbi:MAG: DUF2339 domain-containing protein, partial [Proteobacteria bacterium]|nr:DUF2339 domain-containing protein [Pseudomonadota bacterium]MBU1710740.1 DUF2339 domain-containing protein [Pseudomonadota bacterium]
MQIFLWVLLLIVLAEVMSLRKRIKKLEESNPKGQETEKLRTRKGEIREEVRVPSFTQDLKEEPIATRIAAVSEKKEVKEPPGEFVAEYRKVADARDFFPAPPGPIDKFLEQLKAFFTTGNIVLKVGIIILFFGVAFLLKYAAQRNLFPIEFRLAGVAVFGLSLLIAGWRLRARVLLYGLTLQGGGVGILYLTVFAASKLYHFLPPTLSLVIMVGLVGLSGALAVMQDAKALAIFGITGGFLAPVLMSTGSGSHVMLFSYYALLNAGILGIAWFKAWRVLNLLGFVFTFVIASFWGSNYYQPDYFSTTEPFLVLFFVFYVAISVLFAHRQPPKLKGFIDGPLVFGVSLVSFALQACLVKDFEYGLAISACAAGLFYILLATILWRRLTEGMRMLTEAFLAIGVVFGSLAIPLALDGHWTATAWALEGGAMVWVGVRQKRLGARVFGVLLQFGSGISFLIAACTP